MTRPTLLLLALLALPAGAHEPEQCPENAHPASVCIHSGPTHGAEIPDYDRSAFGGWIDADGDSCDTRCEVLWQEATDKSIRSYSYRGDTRHMYEWEGRFTGETFTDSSNLDVDHLIPLAYAWEAGAWRWAPAVREAYANWLADPDHLVAVDAGANRSKGARGPSEWMPENEEAWCWYAEGWRTVAQRWGLRLKPEDRAKVGEVLEGCED